MSIHYLKGDATEPVGTGQKIITHICNDINLWGAGFVLAISKKWPDVKRRYHDWCLCPLTDDPPFLLGAVQFVRVTPEITIANIIGQHGIRKECGCPPIRYPAVDRALARVADYATELQASVHMPRMGCGLAGGDWYKIESSIKDTLCAQNIEVYVYDYQQ